MGSTILCIWSEIFQNNQKQLKAAVTRLNDEDQFQKLQRQMSPLNQDDSNLKSVHDFLKNLNELINPNKKAKVFDFENNVIRIEQQNRHAALINDGVSNAFSIPSSDQEEVADLEMEYHISLIR